MTILTAILVLVAISVLNAVFTYRADKRRSKAFATGALDYQRQKEAHAREQYEATYSHLLGSDIDLMTGTDFEAFLGRLYTEMGFAVTFTRDGADQGADLIVTAPNGERVALQAKRYSQTVGNAAVQEAIAGRVFYHCSRCIVVTTATFSRAAAALARADGSVQLVDRPALDQLRHQYLADITIPPFSWESWEGLRRTLKDDPLHCSVCGAALRLRYSQWGGFFGCTRYPHCRFTRKAPANSGFVRI
jgi:restriction system protein